MEVDIYDPTTGGHAGKLRADFHAPGHCGCPMPQPLLPVGVQGRLHYIYSPNKRVADNGMLSRKLQDNKSADRAVADFVNSVGGPNPDAVAMLDQPISAYVNATGPFATYDAVTHNCFTFAAAAIDAAFKYRSLDWPERWDALLQYFDNVKRIMDQWGPGLEVRRQLSVALPQDLLHRADLIEVPDALS